MLALLGRGRWFAACVGWWSMLGTVVGGAWVTWSAAVCVALARRTRTGDEVLRGEFGAGWEAYARRVPYGLVPFVF